MNRKSAAVMNWRNRTKWRLIELKGGKCSRCPYDKQIPAAYDFHHEDPTQKDFQIGGKSWSFERLKEEAEKCVLVCKNCHSEIHYDLSQSSRQARLEAVQAVRLEEIACAACGLNFKPDNSQRKYCSINCTKIAQRKVKERPTKEVLEQEIQTNTWVALGKKYGVSDKSVKKWADGLGLTKK